MAETMRFAWTWEPKDVINFTESERFVQVYAPTYEKALKKIFKLKIPGIETVDDIMFISVQEEAYGSDDEGELAIPPTPES